MNKGLLSVFFRPEYSALLRAGDRIIRIDCKPTQPDSTREITQKTTQQVSEFYDVAPFPNYDDHDTLGSLLRKGEQNAFTRDLKRSIGFGKTFLEMGSGTSQLSVYLAARTNNLIFAVDPTLQSLKLGADFVRDKNIKNVVFVNSDVFADVFKPAMFDYVWCSDVLHHTADPRGGFETICRYVKPKGYIFIGLYNRYGRTRLYVRKFLYRLFGDAALGLDPALRLMESKAKRDAWIRDQYLHPVESSHTMDEVLGWFRSQNVEFIRTIPSTVSSGASTSELLKPEPAGTRFDRLVAQLGMIFSKLGGEGGLFIMIGRRMG